VSLLPFVLETVLISLSGVMSPGPVTAVTVGKGNESPHAGALVAIGHGMVEFPLIVAVFMGFGYLVDLFYVRTTIALLGGGLLLYMGIGMLRSIKGAHAQKERYDRFPMLAGVLLSVGNPFFLIWWVTVGAALIVRAVQYGPWGLGILALSHWLCDFLWLYFLSVLSFKGGRFLGKRFQEIVFAVCGVFLLFFGGKYVFDAVAVLFVSS
jgi:threonine/homoserine/homoserine lactone efflux protein